MRTGIHPALTSFADEVCATLARLVAYVGTLALIGILGVHFWDLWDAAGADQPAARTVSCNGAAPPNLSADWVTGPENPRLRGAL